MKSILIVAACLLLCSCSTNESYLSYVELKKKYPSATDVSLFEWGSSGDTFLVRFKDGSVSRITTYIYRSERKWVDVTIFPALQSDK